MVLSDSHSGLSFMRWCIEKTKPHAVIHLGDYFDDGAAMAQEYPHIRFHQVPGNCDRFRCHSREPETLCYDIGGVRLYMTHGHMQQVKSGLTRLISAAVENGAAAALYGHTHIPDCHRDMGIWVLNPGSCGSFSGSCGVIEVTEGKITACGCLRQAELEKLP